jgi:hypothetical protein
VAPPVPSVSDTFKLDPAAVFLLSNQLRGLATGSSDTDLVPATDIHMWGHDYAPLGMGELDETYNAVMAIAGQIADPAISGIVARVNEAADIVDGLRAAAVETDETGALRITEEVAVR